MTIKKCYTCNKIKDINEFHICSSARDKHNSVCKQCRHDYVKRGGRGYEKYRAYQTPYQLEYYYLHKNEDWYKKRLARYKKEFEERHPGYFKEHSKIQYMNRKIKKPQNFYRNLYKKQLKLYLNEKEISSLKIRYNKKKSK